MAEPIFACTMKDLQQNGDRKRMTIDGKDIFILLHKGQLFAFDSFCYHAGGPLYLGDIKDTSEYSCIVCPWHKYKLTVQSGEGLYYSLNPQDLKSPPQLCSKGAKQRTHVVTRQEDRLYITFSYTVKPLGTVESDHYNGLLIK
uniref:Rieske domain-containing protein n=1 Tax=Biomphalaria glabrata TaxID=6526 RepID=A0A2C9LQI3_BIOGL